MDRRQAGVEAGCAWFSVTWSWTRENNRLGGPQHHNLGHHTTAKAERTLGLGMESVQQDRISRREKKAPALFNRTANIQQAYHSYASQHSGQPGPSSQPYHAAAQHYDLVVRLDDRQSAVCSQNISSYFGTIYFRGRPSRHLPPLCSPCINNIFRGRHRPRGVISCDGVPLAELAYLARTKGRTRTRHDMMLSRKWVSIYLNRI
jgi:hypothetical protein